MCLLYPFLVALVGLVTFASSFTLCPNSDTSRAQRAPTLLSFRSSSAAGGATCSFPDCCTARSISTPYPTSYSSSLTSLGGASSSSSDTSSSEASTSPGSSLTSLYLDVSIPNRGDSDKKDDAPLRLIFHLPTPSLLPKHTENIIKLFAQSQRSIDSRCTYVGCTFRHSPQFVEGFPQYRWAHVLDGRGINAVGRGADRIEEREALTKCRVDVVGSGSYYGVRYEDIPGGDDADVENEIVGGSTNGASSTGVVALTVPLSGPGRGSTALSIVRVGDSPQEWGERLLINSAVVGWMDPSCVGALRAMATQSDGPPTVVSSGLLEE